MRAAVTGGSGVVGAAVVRHLVDQGHRVRALARSSESEAKLTRQGADPVPGDVLDPGSVRALVDGCDWVFHVAGVNELCSRRAAQMWQVNVAGTRLVLGACREAGVARMIHTSSAVTIGEAEGAVGTEGTPHRGYYLSVYEKSKTEAERVLFGEAGDLDVVAVNPSSVQGPGRFTGTGRLILNAARGRLPLLVDSVFSLVDIDDCARGHLLAAEHGHAGERYLLSGATLQLREAVEMLAAITGRGLRPRFLPTRLATALAAVVEGLFVVAGRTPPVCREAMRVVSHGHRYDGSRATRDLGLVYTPIETTLRRTVDWFEAERLV